LSVGGIVSLLYAVACRLGVPRTDGAASQQAGGTADRRARTDGTTNRAKRRSYASTERRTKGGAANGAVVRCPRSGLATGLLAGELAADRIILLECRETLALGR